MIIQIGTEVDESRILWKHKESDEWKRADIDDLIRAYEDRPKGEWIEDDEDYSFDYKCSRCGRWSVATTYCPNCGAKMGSDDNKLDRPDWQKEIEEEYEYLHWDIR